VSRPDATAAAALDAQVIRPVFFCYLDIVGDPLRACTAGQSIAFAPGATGEPDLDGHTYDGINPRFIDIGPVRQKDGGSDSITCKLSGLVTLDTALLNIIGSPANWQGRTARLWRTIRDAAGTQQGAIQHLFTGWMTSLVIAGSPEGQTINLTIQSYLAAFSGASGRTYLDQEQFDPGDLSARASIALANGLGSPLLNGTPASTDGGYVQPLRFDGGMPW
jgi:hypothetical protein